MSGVQSKGQKRMNKNESDSTTFMTGITQPGASPGKKGQKGSAKELTKPASKASLKSNDSMNKAFGKKGPKLD